MKCAEDVLVLILHVAIAIKIAHDTDRGVLSWRTRKT